MSRSLSRIRSIVSEIEEIQRQGQQGGKAFGDRVPKPILPGKIPELKVEPKMEPKETETKVESEGIPADAFEDLEKLIDLGPRRKAQDSSAPVQAAEPAEKGRVILQLSQEVVLQLYIGDSLEVIEVTQIGNMLEIRFADGKAVHLPIASVA